MALVHTSQRRAATAAPQTAAAWMSGIGPSVLLVAALLIILPAIVSDFILIQIFGWSYMLGVIALSLMFLAGYGGMVSLAQITLAGFAGYMTAILGVNGQPGGLGWPWWIAVPVAIVLTTIFGAVVGALAVRAE